MPSYQSAEEEQCTKPKYSDFCAVFSKGRYFIYFLNMHMMPVIWLYL